METGVFSFFNGVSFFSCVMTFNLFNPKIIKNYAIYTSIYLKFYIDFPESSDFSDFSESSESSESSEFSDFSDFPKSSEISDSSENSDFPPTQKNKKNCAHRIDERSEN